MYYLLGIFIIISSSIYALSPSFNLAVFGDFWVTIWRYERMVGFLSNGLWTNFSYFFTTYGPQDIITGLLSRVFGYQSLPFYEVSFLLRIIGAFSIYPLALYLSKNKLAAFFAVWFLAVTSTGLETTNWVFNMSTYLVITFFNLFLYLFLKNRVKTNIRFTIISTCLFFITLISSAIRSTGLMFFVFLIDILWLLNHHTINNTKKVVLRLSIFLVIFLYLLFRTTLYLSPDWDTQKIPYSTHSVITAKLSGISQFSEFIKHGNFEFVFYPLAILGGMFIPNFSPNYSLVSYLIGGISLIFWISLIFKNRKDFISEGLSISLIWTFCSFLIPWVSNPTETYTTWHRYLAVSAIGIAVFLSLLVSLMRNKRIILLCAVLIITINIFSTYNYLNRLTTIRNRKITENIWSQFPKIPDVGKTKGPLVFYIDGDNAEQVHDVLVFGLPSHLQLIYKVSDFRSIVTLGSFDELISTVKDGKVFGNQLLPENPVPIKNIYTFYLTNNNVLINTTNQSRDKLSNIH